VTENKPTVFILDDDLAIQDSLVMLFNTMNLETECYSNARDYLDNFDASRTGCLILDVRLPGLGGLECLEKLRGLGFKIPVIVVTGHGDQAAREKAVELGAVALLSKPVAGLQLCELVKQVL
jgi:two-component system response regulator FixJ